MPTIRRSLACHVGRRTPRPSLGQTLLMSMLTEVTRMPLYTAITQEGTVSGETKAKIAEEITRIHTYVMKVRKNFVRVVFLSYPKGSGFTGGSEVPTAALNCVLRSGHTRRREGGHAEAALGDVSRSHWHCNGSARAFSSGDPIFQCHGDGANHPGQR
jgi:phenylpyruvate tautomerase PptA (4-oxalocrotonate tautomerase family)